MKCASCKHLKMFHSKEGICYEYVPGKKGIEYCNCKKFKWPVIAKETEYKIPEWME